MKSKTVPGHPHYKGAWEIKFIAPHILNFWYWIKVSGQLYASITLATGVKSPVHIR